MRAALGFLWLDRLLYYAPRVLSGEGTVAHYVLAGSRPRGPERSSPIVRLNLLGPGLTVTFCPALNR
jgi:hypothetical protein